MPFLIIFLLYASFALTLPRFWQGSHYHNNYCSPRTSWHLRPHPLLLIRPNLDDRNLWSDVQFQENRCVPCIPIIFWCADCRQRSLGLACASRVGGSKAGSPGHAFRSFNYCRNHPLQQGRKEGK